VDAVEEVFGVRAEGDLGRVPVVSLRSFWGRRMPARIP